MAMLDWVRFPTHWIEAEEHHLRDVTWAEDGIDGLAGLMVLIVIVQHTDQETGEAKVTYDLLQKATGLSRSTIARGLGFIEGKLVEKLSQSRYTRARAKSAFSRNSAAGRPSSSTRLSSICSSCRGVTGTTTWPTSPTT